MESQEEVDGWMNAIQQFIQQEKVKQYSEINANINSNNTNNNNNINTSYTTTISDNNTNNNVGIVICSYNLNFGLCVPGTNDMEECANVSFKHINSFITNKMNII